MLWSVTTIAATRASSAGHCTTETSMVGQVCRIVPLSRAMRPATVRYGGVARWLPGGGRRREGLVRWVVDDLELRRREQDNQLAAMGFIAGLQPTGQVGRFGDVAYVSSGIPIRLFNQAQPVGDRAGPEELDEAVRLLRRRGAPFVVHLREGTDDHLAACLAGLGLVARSDEPMPGMALQPISSMPPGPAELEIRVARDAAVLDDHCRVAAAGFGIDIDIVRSFLTVAALADPATAVYAGYVDGQPVATSLGYRTGDTIGVYNVATVESARRRGYGAAMTRKAIAAGGAAGCSVATLQASAMGFPIYESIGFRTVARYRAYVEPGPAGARPA